MENDDNKIERDIIKNSEYIITYFNNEGDKAVTNLMLEKLLYFLEAIYMVMTDEDNLYEEEFNAWNFGPVNTIIYNKYKDFGRMPIVLDKNVTINQANKIYIKTLYDTFKDFSAFDLVNLSHAINSPWQDINKKYNGNIGKTIIIKKKDTKEWFKNLINGK